MRQRIDGIERPITDARRSGWPIVYLNDNWGVWDGDGPRLVRDAVDRGRGGELVRRVALGPGDTFVVKPRYSGFDHTPSSSCSRAWRRTPW